MNICTDVPVRQYISIRIRKKECDGFPPRSCSEWAPYAKYSSCGYALHMDFPIPLSPEFLERAVQCGVRSKDIEEHFVRGGGPGGQKINKTSSCVELRHVPTGICVRVQEFREQHRNRLKAYERLIAKIVEHHEQKQREQEEAAFRERRRKTKRTRTTKEKVLREKKRRGSIKASRISALHESLSELDR